VLATLGGVTIQMYNYASDWATTFETPNVESQFDGFDVENRTIFPSVGVFPDSEKYIKHTALAAQ